MTFNEAISVVITGGKVRRKSWPITSRHWYLGDNGWVKESWNVGEAALHVDEIKATDWEVVK